MKSKKFCLISGKKFCYLIVGLLLIGNGLGLFLAANNYNIRDLQSFSCNDKAIQEEFLKSSNQISYNGKFSTSREESVILTLRGYFDGVDDVLLKDNQLWIHHRGWQQPSQFVVNGYDWNPNFPNGEQDGYSNYLIDHTSLPMEEKEYSINVIEKSSGGSVEIIQNPNIGNDYTLIITVDDGGPSGAYWYEFEVIEEIDHSLSPLTIIYPNGGETLQDIVTIEWSPSTDTWDHSVRYEVLYSIDNGITWKTIETWFYESNYEWDTTELNDGTSFLIKVIAKCTEGLTVEDTSDDTFIVHYLSPPSISTPSQTLKGVITLEWSASVDSLNQNITYSVHYSSDTGNNWNLLVSGLTVTSYDWNTTAVSDGRYYKIKVVASSDGLSSENILYGLLTIDNIPTDNTFLIIGLAIIAIFPELYFFRKLKKFLNYLLIKEGVETP